MKNSSGLLHCFQNMQELRFFCFHFVVVVVWFSNREVERGGGCFKKNS